MKVVDLVHGARHINWGPAVLQKGFGFGGMFDWVYSQKSKDGSTWGLRWPESQSSDPIEGWSVKGRQATLRDFWDILQGIPKTIPYEKNNEDLNMEDLPGFSPMISADEQARIDAEAREKAESAAMAREAEKERVRAAEAKRAREEAERKAAEEAAEKTRLMHDAAQAKREAEEARRRAEEMSSTHAEEKARLEAAAKAKEAELSAKLAAIEAAGRAKEGELSEKLAAMKAEQDAREEAERAAKEAYAKRAAADPFAQAQQKFEAGDYRGAVKCLKPVIDGNAEHVDALLLRGRCSYAIASDKTGRQKEKFLKLAQEDFKAADAADPYHETAGDLVDEVEAALSSLSAGVVSGGASGAGAAGSEHSDPSSSGTPIAAVIARSRGYAQAISEDFQAAQAALEAGEYQTAWEHFNTVINAEESRVLAEAYCGRGKCSLRMASEMPTAEAKVKALSSAIEDFGIAVEHKAILKVAYTLKAEAEAALRPLQGALPSGTAGARDDATVLSMGTT